MEEKNHQPAPRKNKSRHSLVAMIISVLSLALLLVVNYRYFNATYGSKDAQRFEQTLRSKEQIILDEFKKLPASFNGTDPLEVLDEQSARFRKLSEEEGIYFFYYEDNRIRFWSDHSVPIRPRWNRSLERPVLTLPNATYVAMNHATEQGMLLGLILIKSSYPYENDYLSNGYQEDFHLSSEIPLLLGTGAGAYKVTGNDGAVLFELEFGDSLKKNNTNLLFSLISALLLVISLFLFFYWRTLTVSDASSRTVWLTGGVLTFGLLQFLFSFFEIPPIIFETNLFGPEIFASRLFPSLGHLLTWVFFLFLITVFIYRFFDSSRRISGRYHPLLALVFTAVSTASLLLLQDLLRHIVLDSSISFEAFKLNTLSVYTFIGLVIAAFSMLVFCFLILKAMHYLGSRYDVRFFLLLASGILIGQLPFIIFAGEVFDFYTLAFLVLFTSMMIYLRHIAGQKLRMSSFFLPLLVFSLYTSAELQQHTEQKTANEKEIELAKLASQHDVVAEMLFSEISEKVSSDSLLMNSITFPYLDIDFVFNYLQREYFSGYWTKYDLQVTICRSSDSVYVAPPADAWFHCYSFFDEIIADEGQQIPGTSFHFLDNLNGRISYLGRFIYEILPGMEASMFVELDSKIISEELGYPELLLSREARSNNKFSYAIYNKGKLITSKGPFNYRRSSGYYTEKENALEIFRSEGYNHSIMNVDDENMVMVSSPVVTPVNRLISFSYVFAFYFLLFGVTWIFLSAPTLRKSLNWDFKNKIQYSMIGLLFLTFVFICAGTIYFIIQQYRDKHHNNLENTMRSLYIELIHKVEFEEDLRNWSSDSYYNLDELLRKFSNVFYTDINMYDERGILLATSRTEIFEQRLLSMRMNRVAYEKLAIEGYSAFIHTERIGDLKFQSAYVPLLNSENHLLAYLNLPYFTQPGVLTQEVSNLIVAILNIYVILLLTIIFLSFFLADRITQPLRVIQNRIAQLSLSKQNEKIRYRGRDEIRGLVEEYNLMIEELQKSAELLAASERETAWREMAKQIAHEIKNPLTPMKLNLQHLDRLVTEEPANLKEQVRKVIQTLVEQIDSLSSIANEFSDFAKMPKARNREVDLVKKIRNTVQLFQNTSKDTVEYQLPAEEKLFVFGDPEQIQRVIINLVKNGLQSVPEGRSPRIELKLERSGDKHALISIRDNGRGIPEEIRDRLFQPNFTTKSSGMGMGLAISGNIVRSLGGRIWYESIIGSGTVFHVLLPLKEEKS